MYQDKVQLAQHAHFRQALRLAFQDLGMRLGDDVLVLHRNDRNADPDHAAGLAGETARSRDDVLADDVALVGDDLPFAARLPLDRRHRRPPVDLAALIARAARQRLGQVGRLDVAVLGMLDRAQIPSTLQSGQISLTSAGSRNFTSIPPIVAATPA